MKIFSNLLAATALTFLTLAAANAQSVNLITENSAGKVKLGMTVAQVRRAVAPMKVSRTSDGEGVALIAIKRGRTEVMTLYAGEADRDAKINEKARIEQIWVWDKSYRTKGGVRPGMLLIDAEKKYGRVKTIIMSEIESREFGEFTNHPKGIDFRLLGKDSDAGVYPPSSGTAISYSQGAYIFSINVSGGQRPITGGGDASKTVFSSSYTDLKSGCKTVGGDEGGHVSTFCKGPAGYQIHYFDSATTLEFNAENEDEEFSARIASEALDYVSRNSKIEWRLADGKPFAVIMRVFTYKEGGEFPKQGKPTGEFLVVKGLKGFENIDGKIDGKKADANKMAREFADGAYPGGDSGPKDLEDLAARFIPPGEKLAHKVVSDSFGPSKQGVVVLYGRGAAAMAYSGLILVPDGTGHKKYELPKPEFTWSVEDAKAVFFANVDDDPERELLIIGECYTGIGPDGAKPFYRTRVYDWNGRGFVHLEKLSQKIGNGSKAGEAKKKLRIN